jgi:hypothetical protein
MKTQACLSSGATGLVAIGTLLTSRGGGSGESENVPRDTARLNCHVSESASGKAVSEATVNYQAGSTEYTTQTNNNGNCTLDMPASEVAGVKYPAATVSKTGYEPHHTARIALVVGQACSQSPQTNSRQISASRWTATRSCTWATTASKGSVNSQFQKASDDAALNFPISDWADQVKTTGVTKATVHLDAKGW